MKEEKMKNLKWKKRQQRKIFKMMFQYKEKLKDQQELVVSMYHHTNLEKWKVK